MSYDSSRGLSVLADVWVSRAASKQRRGRAGRTAPGACFALFSRKAQANLTPHQPPEMLRTPLQQLCLSIKAGKYGTYKPFYLSSETVLPVKPFYLSSRTVLPIK
jgi:HrpA-like RNA helicase